MPRKPPVMFDEDNPEWTEADFAAAKAGDAIPAHIAAAFPKPRGRPKGTTKQLVSLRIDNDILDRFRATGPGWQSRINEALRNAAG
ncbi:MAG: BrnA antitoxin family protein [Novosphingobium sp.]